MLYESGDVLPPLQVVRADQVEPGDTYWGAQQLNTRKGWVLDSEPTRVEQQPYEREGFVLGIGSYLGFRPDTLVLIQQRRSRS